MRTRPVLWISRPATMRSKVVLPQPDGPRSATNSPSLTLSDTPCRALNPANSLVTSSMTMPATGELLLACDTPDGEQVAPDRKDEEHGWNDEDEAAGKSVMQGAFGQNPQQICGQRALADRQDRRREDLVPGNHESEDRGC